MPFKGITWLWTPQRSFRNSWIKTSWTSGAFELVVGGLVQQMAKGGRRVRAFGEMVALSWMDGSRPAAIELEQLWNDLSLKHAFTLFCAYPLANICPKDDGPSLRHICAMHSGVISLTA